MNPYVWKAQILANLHMWAKSLRVIGPHQPKKKYVYSLLYIPISPLLLLSLLPSLSLPFLPPFPLLFKRKDKSFGCDNYQKNARANRITNRGSMRSVILFILPFCNISSGFAPADGGRRSCTKTQLYANDYWRRNFLSAGLAFSVALANPSVTNAAYGDSAQILIPDVVQGMSDRTNKQCLVESLGNRECLGK